MYLPTLSPGLIDKLPIRLSGNSETAGRRKIQGLPGERKSNFMSFNEICDEIAKRYDSCMAGTTRQGWEPYRYQCKRSRVNGVAEG